MELKHITTLFLSNDGQVPACCGYLPRGGASPFRAYALSPSGRYLFGRCGGSDDCYLALRLEKVRDGCAHGFYVGYCTNTLTFGLFSSAQWLEEYGFMKAFFFDYDSGELQTRRIYLDRALYEQEKGKLHPAQ